MSNHLKRLQTEASGEGTPSKRSAKWDDQSLPKAEVSNRMRVYVRVRPLNDREENSRKSIDVIDNQLLVFDPIQPQDNETNDDHYVYHGKTYRAIGRRPNKNLQFVFDRVFDESLENIEVYEHSTKSFVNSLLNGYNCAVFAYGATGSGKTHTMLGSNDDPGVMFFTTMDLFRQLEQKSEDEKLELSISYFEIYNEVVFDLLDPTSGKSLSVREDSRRGVVVSNLSVHQPTDANHLLEMLEYGNRNRAQHPTDANAESSRSHAVFQISLKKQDFSSSQEMSIQVSKMSLIDLAGSERATTAYKTNRSKGLQREGGNINKSLLALGNCITALAATDSKRKSTYIPYRGSKLTLLLRDSLGGNCQTAMIATVSPSSLHHEETHNTLVYAERAKGIQLNLRQNQYNVGLQPRNYNQLMETQNRKIQELSEQLSQYKQEVERLRTKLETVPQSAINGKVDSNEKLNAVKNSLDLLFEERLELRQQLMDCESNLKKIDLKLLFRKYDIERHKLMATDDYDMSAITKADPLQALYNQKLHYSSLKSGLDIKVEDNETKIKRIESELKDQTDCEDWLINTFFVNQNMNAEFKDKAFADKHSKEMAKEILIRLDNNEELMTESVKLNRHSYHYLNGMGRLSEELETAFTTLLRKVEGKKSVVWKDNISSPKLSKRKELENLFLLPTYIAIPKTPLANTSRNLVSIHDITPYSMNLNHTFEKSTPLAEKNMNLSKLSLTSSANKSSKVAVVSANKRMDIRVDGNNENTLNDTFTVNNRSPRSPSPRPPPRPITNRSWNNNWKGGDYQSPRNTNQYNNHYSDSHRTSGYKSQTTRPYGRQNKPKSGYYPRFRF